MIFARLQPPDGSAPIAGVLEHDQLRETASAPWEQLKFTGRAFDIAGWDYLCPLIPAQVIGVGKNFALNPASLGAGPPDLPILFHKPSRCVIAPNAQVSLPPGIGRIKFEAELAAVIGRRARAVSEAAALEYVCGYTIANDYAALELFHPDGHWTLGKSCDTFCPMGPVIATGLDLSSIRVRSFLNGRLQQDSSLDLMISPLPRLIALISRYCTLEPGDVILTGTPRGAAFAGHGDVVECVIDGIGSLRNPVRDPSRNGGQTSE